MVRLDLRHRRIKFDSSAESPNSARQCLRQADEATAEVCKTFLAAFTAAAAAQLQLVPEPYRRDLIRVGAEFSPEQGLPDDAIDFLAAQFAQPFVRHLAFQRFPIFNTAGP
jgi:hypothetical protein